MSRGYWQYAASDILRQNAYCNVALEVEIDTVSRLMSIDVEVYFTANSNVNSNYLNVAIMQNNVEGPQSGARI